MDVKKHFDLCFCHILAEFTALSRGVLNLVFCTVCGKFRPDLGTKLTLISYLTLLNFKIYRRFCRPLNLKSRADAFKFDFNLTPAKLRKR